MKISMTCLKWKKIMRMRMVIITMMIMKTSMETMTITKRDKGNIVLITPVLFILILTKSNSKLQSTRMTASGI